MDASRFSQVGGHPVLDLMNTVDWRLDPARRGERLAGVADVLDWCLATGVLGADEHAALVAEAAAHPLLAARQRDAVVEWRELAYGAVVDRRPEAVAGVVDAYREALSRAALRPGGGPGAWTWREDRLALGTPRDRLVRATVGLLTDPGLAQLHQCEDEACGWVYLDTSPRHNRRWCKASDCGNRNRARRYYDRHRPGVS